MKATGIFLGILVVLALAWEGYALVTGDVALITTAVAEANVLTGGFVGFALGFLMGHFFFPRERRPGEGRRD